MKNAELKQHLRSRGYDIPDGSYPDDGRAGSKFGGSGSVPSSSLASLEGTTSPDKAEAKASSSAGATGGAAVGAAVGTAIGGPIGTALGSLAGFALGGLFD